MKSDQPTHSREPTPTLAVSDDAPIPITVVRLSPLVFSLCWWLGLWIHAATALFVFCAAFVHLGLSLPVAHANTPALLLPISLKRVSGLSYGVIVILHSHAVVMMVIKSIRARKLTFALRDVSTTDHSSVSNNDRDRILWHLYRRIIDGVHAVFGRDGYFGINSRYFNISITLRELTEVFLQSYQLWSLSRSVSRVWINDFAVIAVVLNCWSIPLVHVVFRGRDRVRRLMLLVVDMILDWICSVLIPVCVTVPYILVYDYAHREFPAKNNSNDVWLANAVAEGRQTIVTSYVDLFASLLPQYSIYACLRLLKRLLVRAERGPRVRINSRTVVPIATAPRLTIKRTVSYLGVQRRQARITRLVSVALLVWGTLVLTFHLHAKSVANHVTVQGCLLYLRPWFVSQPSCSVVYVNCHRLNISGTVDETTKLMERFERSMVTRVVFAHCPALTVPEIVTQFPRLVGLLVHNSTLLEWSRHAAIRQSMHPMFVNLLFSSSNMSEIPAGVFHDELPRGTSLLVVYDCPLVRLPDNIGDVWATSTLTRFILEKTHLTTLPPSLGRLALTQLHISNNRISHLPDDLLANSRLKSLRVSGNPIEKLPVNGGDLSWLQELFVEHTSVADVPPWIVSWLETHKDDTLVAKSFYGSRVCDAAGAASPLCKQDRLSMNGTKRAVLIQGQYPV